MKAGYVQVVHMWVKHHDWVYGCMHALFQQGKLMREVFAHNTSHMYCRITCGMVISIQRQIIASCGRALLPHYHMAAFGQK